MGAFRKVKKYTKPSHEIDEKVKLLNKELKKTGMLSELMTTSNMYMYVDTTPTTQPTDEVWSNVPDTSGIRQGFGAPSGSFTQATQGGDSDDDSTWENGWQNANQLVNSNTLDGNANTPIISSPYWDTDTRKNYAGILWYQGLFNPSYWTVDYTNNKSKGINRNPSPSDDDYDAEMAFLTYINNSIPGFPPYHPEGWISWAHWVPFSIWNPRIDAFWPYSDRTPKYQGVVKQDSEGYWALMYDWLWVGGSQEYISSPSISASPGHTTVLAAHGSGDPDYSSLVFPDQLPAAAGVTNQAWAQLEDKAFAWGGKKKKPKRRTNTGTTNATMTINGMGLSPEAFENKYNMTPQEYLNPATWQQQSSIDSSDEKIAGHYTAPGASRQLQPDGTYGFPKEGDKVNTGGTKGKDFIYQGGNWIPLAFAGSDATQVAVKGKGGSPYQEYEDPNKDKKFVPPPKDMPKPGQPPVKKAVKGKGGSPYQDYEDPNKDKKFVPPPKDMPKPGGKPPIKTAEIDGTQVAGGHYGYGNKGFVDIPGLDWQVSPTQLQKMKDNPERFNLSPAQIRMIKKAEKKMNKQTVSAHYEPQGDDLVENVVIDPVVKAEKKDKFFNAKDIQPEYPKDAPPKLVKGRHPNLIPPTPKNKFVKVTKKDLLRNHKLTSDEVEEVMITINAINEYVSVNPNILKYIQQRYPTSDVRLAELNFKLDRQMVASELYIENQFPENEKVFERIKTITKKNIAATDPKNMEDVKQPPNYLQLELQPPEPLKIKETVTRHFKKKFKTKYAKKWNKGLW